MGIVSRLSTAALLILASAGVAADQLDVSNPSAQPGIMEETVTMAACVPSPGAITTQPL